MDEHEVIAVKTAATQVLEAIGDDMKWEWDARFSGALTSFEKSNEPFVLQTLSHAFTHEWTVANIENAPEAVLIAADFLGGLRSGQRLFTTAFQNDTFCIAAYWPWGNGATVSLRILPFNTTIGPTEMDNLTCQFQQWMHL
ncbi:MAG: hypothetical protein JXX29_19630 [Deltaproteobacteria bacterium]|nr:hypothetical protein [Deltaproteobacteria bacterium]MBN2673901.1 hypothetical protein [Deltaproteobacteria bacterium]